MRSTSQKSLHAVCWEQQWLLDVINIKATAIVQPKQRSLHKRCIARLQQIVDNATTHWESILRSFHRTSCIPSVSLDRMSIPASAFRTHPWIVRCIRGGWRFRSERLAVNIQISKEVRAYPALYHHHALSFLAYPPAVAEYSERSFDTNEICQTLQDWHWNGSCRQRSDSVSAQCTRCIENNGGRWTEQINLNSFQHPRFRVSFFRKLLTHMFPSEKSIGDRFNNQFPLCSCQDRSVKA